MKIIKRDGTTADFDKKKIRLAMAKAFRSVNNPIDSEELDRMVLDIEKTIQERYPKEQIPSVEEIQDLVELTLIDHNYYQVVKSYILYRAKHSMDRKVIEEFGDYIKDPQIIDEIRKVQADFDRTRYSIEQLYYKFTSFAKEDMKEEEYLKALTKAASELTAKEAPDWEYVAGRFLNLSVRREIEGFWDGKGCDSFKDRIRYMEKEGLYGSFIPESYSDEEIDKLEDYMKPHRDHLLNYSGMDLISKRYLISTHEGEVIERPQEMFMGIAMHLALPEKDKVHWAKRLYDIYSKLQVTVATPTMSNARKPFHQLSSCFIDTVPDSLDGIYRSIDNFAQVSKHGGGMGLYFGKVRATGSDIRGFKGVAGGVIRWIKIANDTAVAVDQLGVRQGSVAVYLDAWHRDLPEFLQLRTNNGDDRMKAHDVFPAICYPDLFWKMAKENINGSWYLFDPHEIMVKKGYCLEDSYGKEWEEKYWDCVEDPEVSKRVIKMKDLVRIIIKSWVETGTPFTFNRDIVNRLNPNKHKGMIYSSNLCTEILQNMKEIETISTEIKDDNGNTIIVNTTKAGDFVVCNLASLVLDRIDLKDEKEVERIIETAVRGLDNVIDLNQYPVAYGEVTNQKYRSIGLGTSGYHHALVKEGIRWSDEEAHKEFADKVYEKINYYTIKASMNIAEEKGCYSYFEGSDWQTGEYFDLRGYDSDKWQELKKEVSEKGLRNAYLMAIAPTGSTSIIAGTTAAVDPVMSRYFLEEKKGSILPRVAPGLSPETFWLYENAHDIDQGVVAEIAGIRQRHMDQSQSINIYITTEYTMRTLLNIYIRAWEAGVKTIYYVRSKSLEVAECDSCSS